MREHPEAKSLEACKIAINWLVGELQELEQRLLSDDDIRSDSELTAIAEKLSLFKREVTNLIVKRNPPTE